MKNVCIMQGNYCWSVSQLLDEWTIEDSIYLGWQKDAKYVPPWVWAGWTENEDGTWTDSSGYVWDKDGYTSPDCTSPITPGWQGEWPRVRPSEQPPEEPETPEEPSE